MSREVYKNPHCKAAPVFYCGKGKTAAPNSPLLRKTDC